MPSNAERLLVGLVAVLLLAPGAMGAATEPRFEEYSDRYELSNEDVSVSFHDKKPLLEISPGTSAGNESNESRSYQLHMLRVAEYQDEDGDHAYDRNESAAFVNLAEASDYDVQARSDGDAVHLSMNLNTTIKPRTATSGDPTETQVPIGDDEPRANLTLRFHIYDAERTLDTAGEGVTLDSSEVKFDFEVHRWDWVTDDGRLAFVSEFPTDNDTEVQPENETSRMSVQDNGTEIGYTAWENKAQIQTEHGEETIEVIPAVQRSTSGDDGNETVLLAWSYNATAGYESLLHDPVIGVNPPEDEKVGLSDEVSDVPGPGAALAAAAVLGAATVARRSRP